MQSPASAPTTTVRMRARRKPKIQQKQKQQKQVIQPNYVALARSVLTVAFIDLTGQYPNGKPKVSDRLNAEHFFRNKSECGFWCEAADLEYDSVRREAEKIIALRNIDEGRAASVLPGLYGVI